MPGKLASAAMALRDHARMVSLGMLVGCICIASSAQPSPFAAGGSPAELEQRTFGEFLQPDKPPPDGIRGIHKLMLVTIGALYGNSNQHGQVLRLCRVQMAVATTDDERIAARQCELSALLNLDRFAESEVLFAAMNESLALDAGVAPLDAVRRWRVVAALAAHRGESSLQERASNRIIEIIDAARLAPEPPGWADMQAELRAAMRGLQDSAFRDAEQDAQWSLVRHAYHRQEPKAFSSQFDRLMARVTHGEAGSAPAVLAINSAVALVDLGMRERAVSLASTYLPTLRADAGFRDVPEPIERFVPHPSAVAALGDERTQSSFAKSWVRLAYAYALLGRDAEADRLLNAAMEVSRRYVLEPESDSRLVAHVERASAQMFLWRKQPERAMPLLRSARQRLLNASLSDRSTAFGRRQPEADGELADVVARLLGAIAAVEPMPIRDPALMSEVLELAAEFSASRAEGSARQAARTMAASNAALRQQLAREGVLVDELIDLRGTLSSAIVAGRQAEADAAARRLATTLESLRAIKASIGQQAPAEGRASCPCVPSLAAGQALRQWTFHPAGNLSITLQGGAISMARIEQSLSDIVQRADLVHRAASLRHVSRVSELKQFPRQEASWLFDVLFPDAERSPATDPAPHWILVPPPALDRLPWAALVVRGASVGTGSSSFLVERAALSVVPSVAAYEALARRTPSRAPLDLLAVGDPMPAWVPIDSSALSRRGAVFASLGAMPSPDRSERPSAFAREIRAVSALYGPGRRTVLQGSAATKASLLRLPLSNYRIVLFSTHGHMAGAVHRSVGPSLEMSGTQPDRRFLAADEISRMSLDADLVLLSGCDTSASDGNLDAEGFSGLTSAFLLAGARSVVASLWPVETESAMRLTTETMRAVRRHHTRPVAWAVRDAMLQAIRSPGAVSRHPAFWAAFVVVGR